MKDTKDIVLPDNEEDKEDQILEKKVASKDS
jgi:hypothetical protein